MTRLLPPGTPTKWGRVAAIGWVGERYYWLVARDGAVSMMPASVVEMEPSDER